MQLPSSLCAKSMQKKTTATTVILIFLPCVTFSCSCLSTAAGLAVFYLNAACVDLLCLLSIFSILSIKPWRHLFLSSVPLHFDSIESIDLRAKPSWATNPYSDDDDAMNQNNFKVRSEGLQCSRCVCVGGAFSCCIHNCSKHTRYIIQMLIIATTNIIFLNGFIIIFETDFLAITWPYARCTAMRGVCVDVHIW